MNGSKSEISLITFSSSRCWRASGGFEENGSMVRLMASTIGFLRGRGKCFVARLGNRDGVEFQAQALLDVRLRAIKFAVAEAGEFDGAAHIAGVGDGSGELIDALVAARDERGGNQGHAAADQVHGDQVQALRFVRGKLAEKCSEQIGKRGGGVDALVPAEERLFQRRFHDGGAHDCDCGLGFASRKLRISDSERLLVNV